MILINRAFGIIQQSTIKLRVDASARTRSSSGDFLIAGDCRVLRSFIEASYSLLGSRASSIETYAFPETCGSPFGAVKPTEPQGTS